MLGHLRVYGVNSTFLNKIIFYSMSSAHIMRHRAGAMPKPEQSQNTMNYQNVPSPHDSNHKRQEKY